MTAGWYYAKNKQKVGPLTAAQLKQLARSGELARNDMVWKEGMAKWTPAGQVKGLFDDAAQVRKDTTPANKTSAAFTNLAESPSAEPSRRARTTPAGRRMMVYGGVGVVALIGLAVVIGLAVSFTGGRKSNSKQGNSTLAKKSDGLDESVVADGNAKNQSSPAPPVPQPRKLPDFSKVDYSFDFSKVNYMPVDFSTLDYSKGPQGQPILERKGTHPKEKDSPYWGKPLLERGYTSQSGEFIRHGAMTTWYLGGMSRTKEKKFEQVQFFNGKRHGAFTAWDKNGNKEDEGFAIEGKLYGRRIGLYPSGSKKTESYYVDGKSHGSSQAWHENGQLMAQGQFVDGLRHGHFQRWHPNGAKDDEEFYIEGKLHGPLTAWYANGQKKVESVFVNGKQEARRLEWYENGQKALEIVYIAGLAQGKNLQWHTNGKVFNEGRWQDGKEEGVWIRWHPNGRKQSQVEFISGKRQGLLESWYENGQLDEVATFDQGKKNGKNTRYCPNGRLLFEHQFINGAPHGLWVEYEGTGSGRVTKTFNYP
jgi:antitoxin component YwqK of YwqJK toxin-antitoxin module